MKKTAPLAVLLVAFAAVPAACSKDQPPPVTPGPGADAGADAAPMMIAPVASSAPVADAGAPPPDAGAVGVDMSAALDVAIDTALAASAAKDAPGTKAEGQVGRATLKEGERFNMVVTLAPNRCYSFLGFSPPGQVAELELQLMAPPLYTVQAGKSGANDKAAPIIGKGKAGAMCPLLPIAVPYRLDVVARKGGGRIGVQVFARDK